MQKALGQMNILLHQVVSSITGKTGLKIIHAILAGERDPQKLAALRDERCKRSEAEIARALYGNYRPEHLMQLRQAVRSYEFYQNEILECEQAISHQLELIIRESDAGNNDDGGYGPSGDLTREEALEKICGVDLTKIEGISQASALTILAEIGTDISRWKSAKHFASWLGLCPGIKKSGGRLISSASRRVSNRAAVALRLSAYCLHRSKSALGGYLRRMKSRIGAPKAITATAHKLARLIYALLKYGQEYVQAGQDAYEKQFQTRKLSALLNNAKSMGFKLIPLEQTTVCSL
jgi:transposase